MKLVPVKSPIGLPRARLAQALHRRAEARIMNSTRCTPSCIKTLIGFVAAAGLSTWWASSIAIAAEPTEGKVPEAAEPTAKPAPAAPTNPAEARLRAQWQEDIAKVRPPRKGCFTATYPKKEWREVPCGPPSRYPNGPARGKRPDTVGNGNDLVAVTGGPLISSAVGSFDSVTPSTVTETGQWGGNAKSPNAFTLQINSQFFNTPVCAGHTGCQGWQQFIYSQNQCGGPCVFMEYWLLNYGPTCPPGSWLSHGANDCWFNSTNARAPAITAAQLQGTTLTATVTATTDTLLLTLAGGLATANATDTVVDLSQAWSSAEFNVFGDCCGTQANFSARTTMVPRITLTDGSKNPPICQVNGFTGETNNLSFGPNPPAASAVGPALLFTQSSGGAAQGCAAATSIGDTRPRLTVRNMLLPSNDPGRFTLTIDGLVRARTVGNGGTTGPQVLSPGWHNVSETAGNRNTSLGNYKISFQGDCRSHGRIYLSDGDEKVCTIINQAVCTLSEEDLEACKNELAECLREGPGQPNKTTCWKLYDTCITCP